MSMPVLHQVFQETRRLAIAGSNLAPDDFRLRKLVPALEKSALKSPVFGKVASAVTKLLDSKPKDASQALLDLSGLVMAILYTQGETGSKGKLKKVKSAGIQFSRTQTPARTLKPLIEALTSTGSGRLEIVREAYERRAFEDPRLVNLAIGALDDVYGELAQFIETQVVVKYGPSIVPLIADRIDIQGKAGNVRRLRLLYRFAPELARPIVLEAFEKGSKEMRVGAIGCLGDQDEDLAILLDQAASRNREVREVAYRRIILFDTPEVHELMDQALSGKDAEIASQGIVDSKSKKLLELVTAKLSAALDSLLAIDPKKRKTAAEKKSIDGAIGQCAVLFQALSRRADKTIEKLAKNILSQREHLRSVKGKDHAGDSLISSNAWWIVGHGSKALRTQLAELHASEGDMFGACTEAAILAFTPKRFYDEFHRYIHEAAEAPKRRTRRDEDSKSELVADTVLDYASGGRRYAYGYYYWHHREEIDPKSLPKLDKRWLSDAITADNTSLVIELVTPKDKPGIDYLIEKVEASFQLKTLGWETSDMLKALAESKCKKTTDLVIRALQHHDQRLKNAKNRHYFYGGYYWGECFAHLTKADLIKVEKSLEGMHEQIIDQLMPYIQTAKDERGQKRTTS